ncbi:MAG: alpha/beta fold hydrolase [Deltaproteobacteria bacterium]|nr:alpha/beta fold hydrolase [Deltaproteobacteria bacterium]
MLSEKDLKINEKSYKRTRLVLDVLRRFLKVNIKLHDLGDQFRKGDIFLFNHFARFETFIPQYLIYDQTGFMCRSLAAPELFNDDTFGNYLAGIGAIPTDLENVIHFMACEINRGYKAVIFPEGAMIKNRRVLGPKGRFRIYSREKGKYRKPHTGAAVIALYAQQIRDLFRLAYARKNQAKMKEIAVLFHTEDLERALEIASEPVRIVPANITFYPLRGDENFLTKVADRLGKIPNERVEEELIVEGNILFKNTDMDIRIGDPIEIRDYFKRTDLSLLRTRYFVDQRRILKSAAARLLTRMEILRSEIQSERIMVDYMQSIYSLVTVNLGHLCAELIYELLQHYKQHEVSREFFDQALYMTIKKAQESERIFLHRSLLNPDRYDSLLTHDNRDIRDILLQAAAADLIRIREDRYFFLPALEENYDFDEIRIKNFLKVRYNEVRPIPALQKAVREVLTHFDKLNRPRAWTEMLHDDDLRSHQRDRMIFCTEKYDEINRQETRTYSGAPFFLSPTDGGSQVGVLLIHGFTASPAETRPLGEFLTSRGFVTYGVRLKGHGTSPCDLDFRTLDEWYRSTLRGWNILRKICEKMVVVGFSMGGNLALMLAEEKGNAVDGLVTISTPLKIHDKNIFFAGLMHRVNQLVGVLPYLDGIKRFTKSDPENPEINYRNIPISALREFQHTMERTIEILPEIFCPTLILQGKEDPTVDPVSAKMIYEGIASPEKRLVMVEADHHVIIREKASAVHREVLRFLNQFTGSTRPEDSHAKPTEYSEMTGSR